MRRNIMGDILKEAIADAKAVRETALANAKMALEEAFTPQLKSMLSAKLKEDEFEDEEDEMGDEEEFGEEEPEEGNYYEDDEDPSDEDSAAVDIDIDADGEGGEEEFGDENPFAGDEEDEEEVEENIIELNGQSFRLVPISEEEVAENDEFEEGADLDLEAVIRELESELSEDAESDDDAVEESRAGYDRGESDPDNPAGSGSEMNEEYEIDESLFEADEEDDEEDDEEELDEVDKSSDIGKSDNNRGSTDTSSGIGSGGQEKAKKMESVQAELDEYKEAVSFLKDKLHEVNILNAKLLFTNKLFKEFALDNNQKLKVVETFDRAQSTREIKLVYSTLAEQFGDNGSITKKHSIKESASSKSGSTKPSKESRKVITEEAQVADRFKKLAGIL